LPEDIKRLRSETLAASIVILHAMIHDAKYLGKLRPPELTHLLEVAFDRCGLPRVTQNEVTGADGAPLFMTIRMGDKVPS